LAFWAGRPPGSNRRAKDAAPTRTRAFSTGSIRIVARGGAGVNRRGRSLSAWLAL